MLDVGNWPNPVPRSSCRPKKGPPPFQVGGPYFVITVNRYIGGGLLAPGNAPI